MVKITEAETVFSYVLPQLLKLGWDREDIQIEHGYYDIRIFNGKFILEVKRFGLLSKPQNVTYRLGVPQLQEYLRGTGLTVGCLTDGESWYWVTLDSVHKIEDLEELSKTSIESNNSSYQTNEIEAAL